METSVDVLIPALSALLAVIGLFIDKENPHFKKLAVAFVLLVLFLGYMQIKESKEAKLEAEKAIQQRATLITLADNTATSSMKTSTYLTDILLSQPTILLDFGLTESRAGKKLNDLSTSELITSEIITANKALEQLISKAPPSNRIDNKIWYYNKEMDNPYLTTALEGTGFQVVNKTAAMNQVNDPTNAVWHGPDISLTDYKIVMLSLIRAGIDIRWSGPSCKNLSNKTKVIEIGASDRASGLIDGIKSPTKSVDLILNAKTFEEIDDFTSCN
ncbi:MAG: hypothetical protein CL843_00925 [Crocinitomicaceae bacterium]|nr:hypothetical protein [Crocinitomicaceae bacterium]|tara:strand:+ start:1917 stop:2735 length:819 start_codon:yes stop_codon:yes gene_type:complete